LRNTALQFTIVNNNSGVRMSLNVSVHCALLGINRNPNKNSSKELYSFSFYEVTVLVDSVSYFYKIGMKTF